MDIAWSKEVKPGPVVGPDGPRGRGSGSRIDGEGTGADERRHTRGGSPVRPCQAPPRQVAGTRAWRAFHHVTCRSRRRLARRTDFSYVETAREGGKGARRETAAPGGPGRRPFHGGAAPTGAHR
ncbi:hypothetical protein GCM10017673_22670 [Streptosporangium violaceochromogenes]|nr:hypothetical protein GCM10017673_22670 [Streptosporangium violaceochromogenes]